MTDQKKLIERITTCLEEYGMPKFKDRFPAMSIIQLFKDSGWNKLNSSVLEPLEASGCVKAAGLEKLDEEKVEQSIVSHVGKGEEFNEVCNTMDLAKMICSKFGRPKSLSLESIEDIIMLESNLEVEKIRHLAQALKNAMEDK